jgi:hypothetical protein
MTRVATRPDLTFEQSEPARRRMRADAAWTGWCFVLCTTVAVAYGLWVLYGTGTPVVSLDLLQHGKPAAAPAPDADFGPINIPLGPIGLAREMNPLRAVLRTAFAPIGGTRIHYQIAIVDDADQPVLESQGDLERHEENTPIVRATTNLGDFRLTRQCPYFVRAQTTGGSLDDLRGAKLELRRNTLPVDARIPWAAGLAALAFLIANRIAARAATPPGRTAREAAQDEERAAA